MEKLIELREEIDEIDKKIVDLYERRMAICEQVGEYKIETLSGYRKGDGGVS